MAGLRVGKVGEDVDDGVVVTPAIKVNQACQLFGSRGDEVLAQNLQDKEYEVKYNWNREVRRTARQDVPLAKATRDEEEEKLQRDRLQFLQNQTRLAEEDAELARQYDREEQLAKQRQKLKQEVLDQEMAKRIQVMEIQEQSRPRVRQSRDDGNDRVIRMSSFGGFHLDPSIAGAGGEELTEEERKQLMLMQDEELALALQEHEQMRALRLERSHVVAQSLSEQRGYVTAQQFVPVVIPAQQERIQYTASSRHPGHVFIPQDSSVRMANFSPPLTGHPRSPGPPIRPAPPAPVYLIRSEGDYLTPIRPLKPNDASDRSVTMVTSVGNSEFFRTIPAPDEARSRLPTTANRGDSSPHTNSKTSRQDYAQIANKKGKRK